MTRFSVSRPIFGTTQRASPLPLCNTRAPRGDCLPRRGTLRTRYCNSGPPRRAFRSVARECGSVANNLVALPVNGDSLPAVLELLQATFVALQAIHGALQVI